MEEKNTENLQEMQAVKAAVHFTVGRMCEEVGAEFGVTYKKQVIATIAEVANKQLETYVADLEAFAKHARRSKINAEDIRLLVRRNPQMSAHIKEMADAVESEKAPKKKRGRKASKDASSKVGEPSDK